MRPTYLLGDHHGNYEDLLSRIFRKGIRHARVIHVGDGEEGFPWWEADTPRKLNQVFAEFDAEYLSIRGNHSNPHLFDGSVMLSHFKLLPDYTRLQINGQSWLFVGGAISINRTHREPGQNWWPEESMRFEPKLATPADVLVTHAGPSWAAPPPRPGSLLQYYLDHEASLGKSTLRRELLDEQHQHDQLFELMKPKHWYFGHYHHSATDIVDNCEIRRLQCAELALHHLSR